MNFALRRATPPEPGPCPRLYAHAKAVRTRQWVEFRIVGWCVAHNCHIVQHEGRLWLYVAQGAMLRRFWQAFEKFGQLRDVTVLVRYNPEGILRFTTDFIFPQEK